MGWPDAKNATPYVAIVGEGEAILAPQGWWHYTISLDTSITVMRNFYTACNGHEYYKRRDKHTVQALGDTFLVHSPKLKGKSREERHEAAAQMVNFVRQKIKEVKNGTLTDDLPAESPKYRQGRLNTTL